MDEKITDFLKSQDFLRLGNSINAGLWQSSMMTITRMQKTLADLEFHDFDRNLTMLRQCIARKEKTAAQNALAVIVSKRVAMLNKGKDNDRKDNNQ